MRLSALEQEVRVLRENNETKDRRIAELEAKNSHLTAELMLAIHRMWGKSAEKFQPEGPLLFDELEDSPAPTAEPEVQGDAKKTETRGRKPLSPNLPRKHVFHSLPEGERMCRCGNCMTKFGEDLVEKLNIIPAQVWVDCHHHEKYSCPDAHCPYKGDEIEPGVVKAPGPLPLVPRSIVTAALLTHIWISKFVDHLPFYRQEAGFQRIGADVSRQDMSRWTVRVSDELAPLVELVDRTIREGPVIQMDETPVTVLELDRSRKTGLGYLWVLRGGTEEHPAVRYRFAPGRGSEYARNHLTGFEGFLQTDAWGAYDLAAKGTPIQLVGCWAHVRRKFFEADKAASSELTRDALGRIRKLYKLEDQCRDDAKGKNLGQEDFLEHRKSVLTPYLEELRIWLDLTASRTLPSGLTGKALAYTVGQWDKLVRFLDHPWLTPDNNRAENAIRPFVVGRKNWLFLGNDTAAEASCRIYTLIETAKLNRKEPQVYIRAVLEKLPEIRLSGNWESLLPWNIDTGL